MSQKQNIVFITGNKNKLKEASIILGEKFTVVNIDVDLQEVQSTDVKEVISEKIKEANKVLRETETMIKIKEEFKKLDVVINNFNDFTVVCEDTGFHIDSMNIGEKAEKSPTRMFPGALIKFYLQSLGAEGIIKINKDSDARLSCYIGVIRNGEIKESIEAIVEGKVANAFVEGGFGFDPCFIPNLSSDSSNDKYRGKTYGELPFEIKNEISHRAVAFKKLKDSLLNTEVSLGGSRILKKNKINMKGGSDFYIKYLKYKEKYIDLKTKQ
jgi:inosine triphosphate pyrophosphatase